MCFMKNEWFDVFILWFDRFTMTNIRVHMALAP